MIEEVLVSMIENLMQQKGQGGSTNSDLLLSLCQQDEVEDQGIIPQDIFPTTAIDNATITESTACQNMSLLHLASALGYTK